MLQRIRREARDAVLYGVAILILALALHVDIHITTIGHGNLFVSASMCVPFTPCMDAKG